MERCTRGTPVLDLLATMTAASVEASSLDPQTLMLVRIAALGRGGCAPPSSYLLNLGAAGEIGVDGERVRDVLAAVAPIVGTARVASAVGNVVRALGLAELAAEQQLAEGVVTAFRPTTDRGLRCMVSPCRAVGQVLTKLQHLLSPVGVEHGARKCVCFPSARSTAVNVTDVGALRGPCMTAA